MHFREAAEHKALVGNAVLHTEDRLLSHTRRAQSLERGERVLRLHRQQDRVIRADFDLCRISEARRSSCIRLSTHRRGTAARVLGPRQLSRNKQRNRRARDDIIAKGSPRLMRLLEGFGTIDETVAALERICALV